MMAAVLALSALLAQESADQITPEERVRRRDAKLSAPFMKNAEWLTDYEAARERAARTGRMILAYFTRSWAD
jgi:hypothetical protein